VTFYNNQSAYNAAVTADGLSSSSFNFNSTPSGNYSTAAGLTIDGVNLVGVKGNGGYSLNLTPPYFCCNDYNNPNVSLQAPAIQSSFYNISNGATDITFSNGTTAFSFTAYTVQTGDYTGSGHDTLNLNVNGSMGQTMTTAGSGTGFLGFISTGPVTSAVLTGSTNEDFIDLIGGSVASGSTPPPTPEPATWALMVTGGLLAGGRVLYARRRTSPNAA
jgi:hypothetical protein